MGNVPLHHGSAPAGPLPGGLEVACQACGLDPICSVLDYAAEDSRVPEGVLIRRRPLLRGAVLFSQGDPFQSIFAVKSGAFKLYGTQPGGQQRVIGFHLPGELIGVEAMSGDCYPCTARALEKSSVCELRVHRLPETGRSLETIQRSIINLLGNEVAFSHELISSLIHQSAEQRISGFLLSLSNRLQRRGLPNEEFNLSMSRSDIGSYLGLASETVSRILSKLQQARLILLHRKRARLLDRPALEHLSRS
ncbi:MAG: cyclic nucleotide-binding domain-containing protein [Gammaproteobacteria bacterium]|nr:cyclic nucleotide-binding domain-containing protein [Gammaproteobacteria bacterium]